MLSKILEGYKNNFAEVAKLKNRKLYKLDLSQANKDLTDETIKDTESLSKYIFEKMKNNDAELAYGGYLEDRKIYSKSKHFGSSHDSEVRSIHLGIDIWGKVGEPIFAPLDSIVHSFRDNNNFGDYGPTIILQHNLNGVDFFTLYGHLSKKSLEKISLGKIIKKGEYFTEFGDEKENGNWTPHLHFQIINDINKKFGDFPGVAYKSEIDKYKNICPNPNLILNI